MQASVRRARNLLFGSTMILIALGIVMIYSASAIYAYDTMGDSGYFIKRHFVYLAIGAALMTVTSRIDYKKLRKHAKNALIAIFSSDLVERI
jgi:cell division protein FtsW